MISLTCSIISFDSATLERNKTMTNGSATIVYDCDVRTIAEDLGEVS